MQCVSTLFPCTSRCKTLVWLADAPAQRCYATIPSSKDRLLTAPAPSKNSEQHLASLHTLRALLRECTYLPDEQARQYMRQHVLDRYRKYSSKAWKQPYGSESEARLRAKRNEAHKALDQLQRAVKGERKLLLKVLLMTYGRIGKRRRELMQPLLLVAGREDMLKIIGDEEGHDSLPVLVEDELTEDANSEVKSPSAEYSQLPLRAPSHHELLTPELEALVISQIHAAPPALTRRNPSGLGLDIPKYNIWMKPMPRSRIKNMTAKWYARLLSRTLPPLPREEWFLLLHLASREKTGQHFPPQRRPTSVQPTLDASASSNALEMAVLRGKGLADRKTFRKEPTVSYPPRFMQRLWAEVLAQCPLMEWNADSKEWEVIWGQHALKAHTASPIQKLLAAHSVTATTRLGLTSTTA